MKNCFIVILLFCTANLYSQSGARSRTGVIKGVVSGLEDRKAVAQAVVSVVNDTISVVTNEQGEYTIKHARPGYVTLYVVADGYHALLTESFMVTASAPTTKNIALKNMLLLVDDVVVVASQLVLTNESPVSMRRIGMEEIEMTPGANRDISKVVQSSPGVVATPAQRNDILVRGGGANENKYFLDGIEIPVLNHFAVQGGSGGNASLVNTDMLSSVNFYTGAFPTNFSNGLSSVMDMRMKVGNSERFGAKATLGASDVGLSVDTPISKNGQTTMLASYRRSYLKMLFNILGLPFLPTYNDYQFKVSTKFRSGNELYFLGLGSFDDNKLNKGIKSPDEQQRYILGYLPENIQSSYVFGVGYKHGFDGGQMRIVLSRNYFNNKLYKYEDNDESQPKTMDYKTKEADYRARVMLERWFDSGLRLTAGVGGGHGSYNNQTRRAIYVNGAQSQDLYKSDLDLWRYEAFTTLSKGFFDERLAVVIGARVDAMNYNSKTENPLQQISPRLSISYNLSSKWSLNGSVGRYHQEPTYTTMGFRKDDKLVNRENGLSYIAANHYIAGVEFNPNANSRLALEGFYKAYSNYPVSLRDSLPLSTGDFEDYTVGDQPVVSVGTGRAYGAEFSYRNLDLRNTVINLSYTFLYSQFNSLDQQLKPISGSYNPSAWDVRNIINVSAIHKFKRNWVLGAKWYYIGGFPFTPYDEDLSADINAWNVRNRPYLDYGRYNSERSGAYHQLDVRLDKMWFLKSCRVGFYIDVQNLYNFSAESQAMLTPETDPTSGDYIVDPSDPSKYKMKSIKNNLGGTILPTLGITIEF